MINISDIDHAINWSQLGLKFLKWIHVVFIVGWVVGSIVDGFSEGWYHMFIMFLEPILIALQSDSVSKVLIVRGLVVGETKHLHSLIKFTIFVTFACFAVNIAHFIVSIVEVVQCTSVFCINTYWFLVTFIVWLGLLIFLEGVEMYFFFVYLQHVRVLDHYEKRRGTHKKVNV